MTASGSRDASPGGVRAGRAPVTTATLAIPLFAMLGIELILGVVLNVFVTLPMGASVVALLTSSALLDVHILFAVTIIGISARAVLVSRRQATRNPLYGSVVALLSALVATAAGWDFAFYGQAPAASLVMSLGFVGVLVGAILMRGWVGGRSSRRPADGAGVP